MPIKQGHEVQEQPEKQFKGWWIPEYVVSLFEEKKINSKELILLATIDSFAKRGKGCFASNAYLGEKVNVGVERIKQMISHLVALELLVRKGFDGRTRRIETYWSRNPNNENTEQTDKKLPVRDIRSYPSDGQEVTPSNLKESAENIGKTGVKPEGKNRLLDKSIRQEDKTPSSKEDGGTAKRRPYTRKLLTEDFDVTAGERIREVLTRYDSDLVCPKNGRRAVRIDALVNSVTRLRTERSISNDRIKAVIKWMYDHYGDTYCPKMRKADDLYNLFKRFEEAIQRQASDEAREDGNGNGRSEPTPLTPEKVEIARRVRARLEETGRWYPDHQCVVDEVLVEMGLPKMTVWRWDL